MTTILKCIIVDDEPPAIRLLEKLIDKVSFLEVQATFSNPLEALQYISTEDIDVIFLDIQMPEISGIQLSKLITSSAKVIFTTAYPQFALDSYELGAVDYLLKPISFERFYKAVMKLQQPTTTSVASNTTSTDEFFFLKKDGKNRFAKIFMKDILYIEGLKNYISVFTQTERIITYSTLKSFKDSLPQTQFIQVHKSFIVAIQHIQKIDNDTIWVNDKELPLGNTYRKAFFAKIGENKL